MGLFNRPAPQQAVPADLAGGRQQIIDLLFGSPGMTGRDRMRFIGQAGGNLRGARGIGQQAVQNAPQRSLGILGDLLGLTSSATPGGDVLGPLSQQFQQNLDYGLSAINASSPGRFSTANTYTQGQFTQRALTDYNVLASQVLEHGRDRQLRAIMGLLNPAMGPMFGGPFTQDASPWENILGGVQTLGGLGGGGLGGFLFNASGGMRGNL